MDLYKKALLEYTNHLKEEEARRIFWRLFEKFLDNEKENCAELVSCLAGVIEHEN